MLPILRNALALGCFATLAPVGAAGQESPVLMSWEQADFYLLQAFHAARPEQRLALNHIGLLAHADGDAHLVDAVLNGFPASAAGLRPGDRILLADGKSFHPVHTFNTAGTAAGPFMPDPTPRTLEVERNGVRELVLVSPVFGNLYDAFRTAGNQSMQLFSNGNKLIGYLRPWSLGRSANDLQAFRAAIDSLAHCDGLIIDLRDAYGFITAEHLDSFFPSRSAIFAIASGHEDFWQASQPGRAGNDYFGRAMVVIQNRGTRAGMELLAYQLGKLQRVISLGETTAGKPGRVSSVRGGQGLEYTPLPGLTVDGRPLEGIGFDPEQAVAFPAGESPAADPQFDAAMLSLMTII